MPSYISLFSVNAVGSLKLLAKLLGNLRLSKLAPQKRAIVMVLILLAVTSILGWYRRNDPCLHADGSARRVLWSGVLVSRDHISFPQHPVCCRRLSWWHNHQQHRYKTNPGQDMGRYGGSSDCFSRENSANSIEYRNECCDHLLYLDGHRYNIADRGGECLLLPQQYKQYR